MRKSKLPKSVKVHGTKYTVVQKKRLIADDQPIYGYCDLDSTTIAIQSGLSQERADAVLRHEIGHACWHETGFGHLAQQAIKDAGLLEMLEEDFVRRVLPAYVEAVKDSTPKTRRA